MEAAERAAVALQREEELTAGTSAYDRFFVMLRQPGKRDELVARLTRKPEGLDEALGGNVGSYGRLPLQRYWEDVFSKVRELGEPGIPPVAASTLRSEGGFWKQINAALGHIAVADLDAWKWEDYVAGMTQHPRTKAMHRAAYKALLAYAHRRHHIDAVHAFFPIKGSTSRARAQVAPLTLDEIARLLDVAEKGAPDSRVRVYGPMRRLQWAIGVGQGLRPSELCRCEFEDFDLERHTMKVRGDPERQGRGKTALSATEIPLTPFTERELRRYLAVAKVTTGPMFVWRNEQVAEFKKALALHAEEAGIVREDLVKDETGKMVKVRRPITPYLLRHSFATLCWTLGIDKEITRRIGRWTTSAMLDEVYCRPSSQDIANRLRSFDFDADALVARSKAS